MFARHEDAQGAVGWIDAAVGERRLVAVEADQASRQRLLLTRCRARLKKRAAPAAYSLACEGMKPSSETTPLLTTGGRYTRYWHSRPTSGSC